MPREDDDYKERARQSKQDKQDRGRYTIPANSTVGVRILKTPPGKNRKDSPGVWLEYYMHPNVGPNNRFIRCGKNPIDKKGECWICDVLIPRLQKKGKTELAASMEQQIMFGCQIAVVEGDRPMRGPLMFSMRSGGPQSLAYKLTTFLGSTKRDYTDHKRGRNIEIERTGSGKTDTKYLVHGPEDESSKVPKSIVRQLQPFSALLPKYDEDAQKNAYYGNEDDDMAKKKSKKNDAEVNKKKKGRSDEDDDDEDEDEEDDEDDDDSGDDDDDEEEEEDDDDEDDDDEDDDDKKKKKKKSKSKKSSKKKKKSKKDDDDDDDDEDDDDEDEDEDDDDDEDEEEDDDDDDEDDDEDDDDEDEKPKKGKKGKKSKPVKKGKKKKGKK